VLRKRKARSGRQSSPEFRPVLAAVEEAKAAAVSAVPNPRGHARPLAEALFEFEEDLREAKSRIESWADGGSQRAACEAGLDEAFRRAEQLRLGAPELTYETLLSRLAELLDPLEPFEDAARSLLGRSEL
jgi:hypothetical protein